MRYLCTSIVAMLMLAGTTVASIPNIPDDYATIQDTLNSDGAESALANPRSTSSEYAMEILDDSRVAPRSTVVDCIPLVIPGCVLIAPATSSGSSIRVYDPHPTDANCSLRGEIATNYLAAGIEIGPNGNIFVWKQNEGPLYEYDAVTGELVGERIPHTPECNLQGRGFCFMPDGDILVSGGSADKVGRFDWSTGSWLGNFVTPGAGGLDICWGIEFGPSGNLYAASHLTNSIIEFDGNTGSYLSTFSSATSPYDLTFAPNGVMYVSTREDGHIEAISPTGVPLGQLNSVAVPPARGIDVGLDGRIYVASWDSYEGYSPGAYEFDAVTGDLLTCYPRTAAIFCTVAPGDDLGTGPIEWPVTENGNGNSYELVTSPTSLLWSEAQALAFAMGGHLATLTSPEENAFVFDNLAQSSALYYNGFWGPWLGGYQDVNAPDYSEPDGGWRWVTGEVWDWQHWDPGQPDNSSGDDRLHFVARPPEGIPLGEWNDWPGSTAATQTFIVEYPVRSITWEIANGGNGHTYELVVIPSGLTWLEARVMAEGMGGHLATLATEAENQFVSAAFSTDVTWHLGGDTGPFIGAFQDLDAPDYSEPDGGWKWINGEPWTWSSWLAGEPNNAAGGEHVGHLTSFDSPDNLGRWNDISETQVGFLSFLVEYTPPCNADVNHDYEVNVNDLLIVIAVWGLDDPLGDVDQDGIVGVNDLLIVIANWGPCP